MKFNFPMFQYFYICIKYKNMIGVGYISLVIANIIYMNGCAGGAGANSDDANVLTESVVPSISKGAVLASVNDDIITVENIGDFIILNKLQKKFIDSNNVQFLDTLIQILIKEKLISQNKELFEKLKEAEVTEQEIKSLYMKSQKMEYYASHILVKTETEAKHILDKLKKGANFEKLAKEYSIDPNKINGGNLGWFTKGVMVNPFYIAVMELNIDENSNPIKTKFGWHIIKLNDSKVLDMYEVRDILINEIKEQKASDEYNKIIKKAIIEIRSIKPSDIAKLMKMLESKVE